MRIVEKWVLNFKWQVSRPFNLFKQNSVHLDMGCGKRPANPFNSDFLIGADMYTINSIFDNNFKSIIIDNFQIPLEDSSVDSISAYDFLEHVPRNQQGGIDNPFIQIMNVTYRVLKQGGIFLAVTPAYPSPIAFQDPTHLNIITKGTLNYFADEAYGSILGYGVSCRFKIIVNEWLVGRAPYIGRMDANSDRSINNYPIEKKGIKNYLKIIKRTLIMLLPHRRTHLLWVLQK